jgi:hypothetical protein
MEDIAVAALEAREGEEGAIKVVAMEAAGEAGRTTTGEAADTAAGTAASITAAAAAAVDSD